MKKRTAKFAVKVIAFCNSMKYTRATSVITYQIVASVTSAGANYSAACNARSKTEFFSKLSIVLEEIEKTEYWLQIIKEAGISNDKVTMEWLINEAEELKKETNHSYFYQIVNKL
ncbi:MAG: four helix bundle protein [Flavobacteriales bacterium]|nr:four helix bundle protein [Flavobacteriales bacterium]